MSNEELAALLVEWQKRLRLQDWDITCEIVPVSQMNNCRHTGNIRYDHFIKTGRVKLLEPSHYDGIGAYDVETTLVHELLHCHFASFDADSETPEGVAQEQAIHAISCALVATKREGLHSEPPDTV